MSYLRSMAGVLVARWLLGLLFAFMTGATLFVLVKGISPDFIPSLLFQTLLLYGLPLIGLLLKKTWYFYYIYVEFFLLLTGFLISILDGGLDLPTAITGLAMVIVLGLTIFLHAKTRTQQNHSKI